MMRPGKPAILPPRHHGVEAFVITLARTPQRTAGVLAQVAPLALPTTIVWATDAREAAALSHSAITPGCQYQPGELALVESWRRALSLIVRRGLEWAVVFEDDAEEVRPGMLAAVQSLPEGWSFAVLHDEQRPVPEYVAGDECGPFQRVTRPAWQSHAVAVSAAGARALLERMAVIDCPIDELFRRRGEGLRVYQCKPDCGFYAQTFFSPSTVRDNGGAGNIPKIIHRIWLNGELPEEFRGYGKRWLDLHVGWKALCWNEDSLRREFPDARPETWGNTAAAQSDVWRLLLLERFGGLYVDTDYEPFRAFDRVVSSASFLASLIGSRPVNGLLACTPGHPLIKQAVAMALDRVGRYPILEAAGPKLIEAVLAPAMGHFPKPLLEDGRRVATAYGDTGVVCMEEATVYPYLWTQPRPDSYPAGTYAAHHWARSWWTPQDWLNHSYGNY